MRKTILSILVAFSVWLAFVPPGHTQMKAGMGKELVMTDKGAEFGKAMRMLWEDHITYTRNFIISSLAGLEDAGPIAERLLRNQDDIGNAVKPFYGEEAGTKLSALLRAHILIAAEVVKAAKAGDTAGLDAANKKWFANADDLAAFLGGANPNWNRAELQDFLHKHLDYTTQEAVCRLKKDWTGDIAAYDKGHAHMMMFADILTRGILMQFRDKFES